MRILNNDFHEAIKDIVKDYMDDQFGDSYAWGADDAPTISVVSWMDDEGGNIPATKNGLKMYQKYIDDMDEEEYEELMEEGGYQSQYDIQLDRDVDKDGSIIEFGFWEWNSIWLHDTELLSGRESRIENKALRLDIDLAESGTYKEIRKYLEPIIEKVLNKAI